MLTKANNELKYYEIRMIKVVDGVPIMCEDGEYRKRNGYSVYNKETDTHEHTTTLLPGAIFQAQHLDATLDGLLNPVPIPDGLADMPVEDVQFN
jgi:hypothetical protein